MAVFLKFKKEVQGVLTLAEISQNLQQAENTAPSLLLHTPLIICLGYRRE